MSRKGASENLNSASGPLLLAALIFSLTAAAPDALARDASFIDPGSAAAASDDAVKVEPKSDIDIGESALSVSRHLNLFFANQSGEPVKVEKVAVNGDGNVATEIVSDDCSKQGAIPPGSRCSVEVSVTPSSSGVWSADVLLTHGGAGRIARAKLTGKTAGTASGEKKDMGLALNTKEATPVNFGDVDVGSGKTVRSALMVNDSPEPITLYSIDVIEASNGLQRLEQGCAVDMELRPGESCPVTLVWKPENSGHVSTDLIIRHSGRMGFVVIPVRGIAKGGSPEPPAARSATAESVKGGSIPPPPTAQDIAKAVGGAAPAVSAAALSASTSATTIAASAGGSLYLIGTVGNRAVILKPDGKTVVANSGDDIDLGDRQAKVVLVGARSVDILLDGKKKTLSLGASPELVAKASLLSKSKESASGGSASGAAASTASAPAATAASGAPAGGSMYGGGK